ncbi:MAG: multidrug effflux MFS transporter [Actinomycetota bacterium]|nr:multidrug effflux MFS transporter [Actinomycetota bacterium]
MSAARDLIEQKLGRFEFILMLSMTMAVAAMAIDMMLPAMGDIRETFGLADDSNASAAVLTFFFFGLGVGQLLWGPLSDALGRKRVLYVGMLIYILAAIASALAPSLGFLFAARFVWGIGGAAAYAVARSVVRDTYQGSAMATAMSFIMAIFLIVPIVAPALGAAVLVVADWRWIFGFTALFGIGISLWTLRLPETLEVERRIPLEPRRLVEAAKFVLSNPMTMGYTFAQATVFGLFASYLASSQLFLDDVFDLEVWFPLFFGGSAVVMGTAMLSNTRLLRRFELQPLLRAAFTGYLATGIVFAGTMIATGGHPSFAVFCLALMPLLVAHALLIPNLNAIAMIPMGSVAGTAAAIIGTISSFGGATIGAIIDSRYDGSLVPFGIGAACTAVVAYGFMRLADGNYEKHVGSSPREPVAVE